MGRAPSARGLGAQASSGRGYVERRSCSARWSSNKKPSNPRVVQMNACAKTLETPDGPAGWVQPHKTHMWASFLGTIGLSLPTRARPVALMRLSPLAVRGMSVVPV